MESFVSCKIKKSIFDKHLIDLDLKNRHLEMLVDDCFITQKTEIEDEESFLKVFVISKLQTKALIELPSSKINSRRVWISSDLLVESKS